MPQPHRHIRARHTSGWSQRQLCYLLTGHDWTFLDGEGWELRDVTPEERAATVADMLACWQHCRDQITDKNLDLNHEGPPWFAQYADNPQQLIDQATKARAYIDYQHDHRGYRPYAEFEAQYSPA